MSARSSPRWRATCTDHRVTTTRHHSRVLAALIACAVLLAPTLAASQEASPRIVLAYVLPDSTDADQAAFDRGVRLGVAEARHAAGLLRRSLEVIELPSRPPGGSLATHPTLREARVVIVPELTDSLTTSLAPWLEQSGRAILTSSAPSRRTCSTVVFRTGPDSASRVRMVMSASAAAPSSTRLPSPGTVLPRVELWHHELERFGARQLSDRYHQRHGQPMTSRAWEGWIAVKIAWESALRARDGDVAAAITHGAFDGHKGAALRFGADDRVLHQPLVIVAAGSNRGDGARSGGAGGVGVTLVREVAWPTGATDERATAVPSAASCRE